MTDPLDPETTTERGSPPRRRSTVRLATRLEAPADWVAERVWRPAILRHVAAPLLRFAPVDPPAFPDVWEEGGRYRVALRLLGVVPLGTQWIVTSRRREEGPHGPIVHVRDAGSGRLARTWDHHVRIEPTPDGATRYEDRVTVDAGPLTPLVALFARLFYAHRQRRWRRLARERGAARSGP